jgi:hypothetical protein
VAAFTRKDRLGREANSPYSIQKHALEDGQRVMRLERGRGSEWGFDPNRVGIVGFSAGGEVTSMVTCSPGQGDPKAADPIDRLSSHPNLQVLIYPGPLGIPETIPVDAPPRSFSWQTTIVALLA